MSKLTFRLIVLAILGLGLILSGVSATLVHTRPSVSPEFVFFLELLERLGDALAIAAIVGGVIEQLVFKKEYLKQVKGWFIDYFGGELPEELRERLREYLEISLIRTTWDITYAIEHWTGHAGYLRLKTTMDYYMENHAEESEEYEFVYEVEDSLCPEISQTAITSVRVVSENYDADQLKRLVKPERGYQVFESDAPVNLEPHAGPGHPTYPFHAESVECFKGVIVSPFWALYPVMKTTVTIWYPDDIELFFDVTLGDVEEVTTKEPVVHGNKKGTCWTINRPILPGQGFHVRCNLKPPAQSGASSTTPSVRPSMIA